MVDKFPFFKSYIEALKELPADDFKAVMCAVCDHAFDGKDGREVLEGIPKSIYVLIEPSVDKSTQITANRSDAGSRGGAPAGNQNASKAGDKQAKTNNDAEEKQAKTSKNKQTKNENKQKQANDKQKQAAKAIGIGIRQEAKAIGNRQEDFGNTSSEEVKDNPPAPRRTQTDLVRESDLSDPVKDKLLEWLQYKSERREGYKETGLRSLISEVRRHEQESGSTAVVGLINECMASGWHGIIWDKLKDRPMGTARDRPRSYTEAIDNRMDVVSNWLNSGKEGTA